MTNTALLVAFTLTAGASAAQAAAAVSPGAAASIAALSSGQGGRPGPGDETAGQRATEKTSGTASSGTTASPPTTSGATPSSMPASNAPASSAAASSASAAQTSSSSAEPLPVSLDRIRRGLKADAPPAAPLQRPLDTEDGVPRFSVRTESPRTIRLSDYLANTTTAVPAYVRPPFDPYHYEFLEMTTPDDVKGCARMDDATCLQTTAGRVTSGLIWQQVLGSGLRNLFTRP